MNLELMKYGGEHKMTNGLNFIVQMTIELEGNPGVQTMIPENTERLS